VQFWVIYSQRRTERSIPDINISKNPLGSIVNTCFNFFGTFKFSILEITWQQFFLNSKALKLCLRELSPERKKKKCMWCPKLGPAALPSDSKVFFKKKRWPSDQNHRFLWFESLGLTLTYVLNPCKRSGKYRLRRKINCEGVKVSEVCNIMVLNCRRKIRLIECNAK
jgi:hypothetical protein